MKLFVSICAIVAIFFHLSCKSQNKTNELINKMRTEYSESDFVLSLVVLKVTLFDDRDSVLFNKDKFIKISGLFSEYFPAQDINAFLNRVLEDEKYRMLLNSEKLQRKIYSFIDAYKIVSNLIFSDIDDDDLPASQEIERKITEVPELLRIYRFYLKEGQNLSSLPSTGGIALDIHIAYYLSLLPNSQQKKIIKKLL